MIAKQVLAAALMTVSFAGMASAAPTWEYNASSGNLPNAAGEPFEGGTAHAPHASIVDLGGGDLVLRINTSGTGASTYFEQDPNTNPGTEWNVDASVGYSIEWMVRLDSTVATDPGAADLIFGDGTTFTSLRLSRQADGGPATALIKSGLSNDTLDSVTIADPDAFNLFRIDKLDNIIDLYINGDLVLDGVVDPFDSTLNLLRFGDGSGAPDGNHDTRFLRTYQDGVIPEPATLGLVGLGGLVILLRRRTA